MAGMFYAGVIFFTFTGTTYIVKEGSVTVGQYSENDGKNEEKVVTLDKRQEPKPDLSEMAAEVTFMGDYFWIRNRNKFDWGNCVFKLNLDKGGGAYVLNGPSVIKPLVGLSLHSFNPKSWEFAKGEERFDPQKTKPLNMDICCEIPKGKGHFYAEFD